MEGEPMKRVLAVVGSPKGKGNTYRVVKAVEERMKALGDVELEYLFLKDANLEMCRGCFGCILHGEDRCPIDDDRAEIERRMLDADGVIFATPVYVMNMSVLMKNLFERFSYAFHRPRFFRQTALLVATTGGVGLKETLKALAAWDGAGFHIAYRLGLRTPPFLVPLSWRDKTEKEIDVAARAFHEAMMRGRPSPRLPHLMHFRIMRAIVPLLRDAFPADYAHYKAMGWLDPGRRYFVETKVNPFKRMIAGSLGWVTKRQLKKGVERQDRVKLLGPS
jgi:NAD(P)H-dependent FMN reductase